MDLSRRRVDKKLPIYIGSFFLSPLLLDLMSVPTKWNKVCCCSGHSERSGRYLNRSLTQLSIDGWCHDGCQTFTNMDSIFSDDYWGAHWPKFPLPYALQIQFRTRGYSKNILSQWHTSVATFAFLSGNSRPNILLRSSGWPSHETVILSAISTHNIPAINIVVLGIIFILHAVTYLGTFFALRFLGVFGFLNSNFYLPHFHWDVWELRHANLFYGAVHLEATYIVQLPIWSGRHIFEKYCHFTL